jgi:hypothetical protein
LLSNLKDGLILSLYALILDFIFGSLLFASFLTVPKVKKVLKDLEGTRHLERYTKVAKNGFIAWTTLLISLIILVFVEKFTPSVYRTTHIALILNNLNQLINTMQFYAAFQFLRAVEFLMKLGSGRKQINSFVIDDASRSDVASDADPSPSMKDMFLISDKSSDGEYVSANENLRIKLS